MVAIKKYLFSISLIVSTVSGVYSAAAGNNQGRNTPRIRVASDLSKLFLYYSGISNPSYAGQCEEDSKSPHLVFLKRRAAGGSLAVEAAKGQDLTQQFLNLPYSFILPKDELSAKSIDDLKKIYLNALDNWRFPLAIQIFRHCLQQRSEKYLLSATDIRDRTPIALIFRYADVNAQHYQFRRRFTGNHIESDNLLEQMKADWLFLCSQLIVFGGKEIWKAKDYEGENVLQALAPTGSGKPVVSMFVLSTVLNLLPREVLNELVKGVNWKKEQPSFLDKLIVAEFLHVNKFSLEQLRSTEHYKTMTNIFQKMIGVQAVVTENVFNNYIYAKNDTLRMAYPGLFGYANEKYLKASNTDGLMS